MQGASQARSTKPLRQYPCHLKPDFTPQYPPSQLKAKSLVAKYPASLTSQKNMVSTNCEYSNPFQQAPLTAERMKSLTHPSQNNWLTFMHNGIAKTSALLFQAFRTSNLMRCSAAARDFTTFSSMHSRTYVPATSLRWHSAICLKNPSKIYGAEWDKSLICRVADAL